MVTTIGGKMTPAGSGRTGNGVDWGVLVMRTPIDTCKCKGVNLRRSPDIPPPIAANASGGGCGPEVDGSEGAPRSPCLSPRRQRGAIGSCEQGIGGAAQHEVGGGEGVGLAHAQGDVVSGPRAEPPQGRERQIGRAHV